MKKDDIAAGLAALIPDRSDTQMGVGHMVDAKAQSVMTERTRAELNKIVRDERQKIRKMKKAEERAASAAQAERVRRQAKQSEERIAVAEQMREAIEDPLDCAVVAEASGVDRKELVVQNALKLQGTGRPEVDKLLSSLGVNMSLRLTRSDTANLLACLLTCNETQLAALLENPRMPLAIKTVIRRLQEDARTGDLSTVEKLWDRIFGKGQMQVDLAAVTQTENGILPNTPISREAYIVIRDTLLK